MRYKAKTGEKIEVTMEKRSIRMSKFINNSYKWVCAVDNSGKCNFRKASSSLKDEGLVFECKWTPETSIFILSCVKSSCLC